MIWGGGGLSKTCHFLKGFLISKKKQALLVKEGNGAKEGSKN